VPIVVDSKQRVELEEGGAPPAPQPDTSHSCFERGAFKIARIRARLGQIRAAVHRSSGAFSGQEGRCCWRLQGAGTDFDRLVSQTAKTTKSRASRCGPAYRVAWQRRRRSWRPLYRFDCLEVGTLVATSLFSCDLIVKVATQL